LVCPQRGKNSIASYFKFFTAFLKQIGDNREEGKTAGFKELNLKELGNRIEEREVRGRKIRR
jgi:hypothetical protein